MSREEWVWDQDGYDFHTEFLKLSGNPRHKNDTSHKCVRKYHDLIFYFCPLCGKDNQW